MKRLRSALYGVATAAFIITAVTSAFPRVAVAAPLNLTRAAKVSFTFDDGLSSAYTLAAPTLQKYGFTGTNYVISGCVGMTTVPNACKADDSVPYMTWAQVSALRNTYGWEIGSHTVDHPYLASTDPDDQPTALTTAQITAELRDSKAAIKANTGIDPTAFASPYGDYNPSGNPVLAEVAKLYTSHRGFADTGYNITPYDGSALPANDYMLNDYLIRDQQVQAGVSVATVRGYIDKAIADNAWLVLTFHEIKNGNASTDPDDYQYNNGDLDLIAQYVKQKAVPVVNISDGLATSNTNLLANGSFDSAIGTFDGTPSTTQWTTDDPTNIKRDTGNHGNFPSPTNSISMAAGTANNHLFSPLVTVSPASTYYLKNFVNITKINATAGSEMAFFIDEYDASGNYLATQYKKSVISGDNPLVKTWSFGYVPGANTAKARLQIDITANSGIQAYVDNLQWFLVDSTVTPPVTTTGDINGDSKVDALDLSLILSNWSRSGVTHAQGDLNADGVIDALDLSTVLSNWSK